ncbi:porin family protein [soil metagenome]|jgi:hypothetical protein
MKKLIFTLTLLTFTAFSFGQSVNFGIKAGINLSSLTRSGFGYEFGTGNLTGFHIGGIADFKFRRFSIQPGLFFTTKGEKISGLMPNLTGGSQPFTAKTTLDYIEVPVNFIYRIPVHHAAVYFGGGPYFAYGISASYLLNGQSYPATFGTVYNKGLNFKNPDYGISFIAGVQLKNKFIIDAGYGLGLANLSYGTGRLENRVISFSVGYLFR